MSLGTHEFFVVQYSEPFLFVVSTIDTVLRRTQLFIECWILRRGIEPYIHTSNEDEAYYGFLDYYDYNYAYYYNYNR